MRLNEHEMPRKVFFGQSEAVHLFTDSSLEESADGDQTAGLGAVLVDEKGRWRKAFSFIPKPEFVKLVGGKIHQQEILPVIMACFFFLG